MREETPVVGRLQLSRMGQAGKEAGDLLVLEKIHQAREH